MIPTEKREKFSIYFDRSQWARLKSESARTGAPIAELVRRAVRERYPDQDEDRRPARPDMEEE